MAQEQNTNAPADRLWSIDQRPCEYYYRRPLSSGKEASRAEKTFVAKTSTHVVAPRPRAQSRSPISSNPQQRQMMAASHVRKMPTDFETRAVADYSQFSQHLRACLQFIFAANGGAAVAMLSCLTAIATAQQINKPIVVSTLLFRFACSTGFYLLGVFCAVLALIAFTLSKQSWGHFWEDNGFTQSVDFGQPFARAGELYSRWGFGPLFTAAAAFVPASAMAILAFFP